MNILKREMHLLREHYNIQLNISQAEPEAKPHSAKPQAEPVYHSVTVAAVDQLIITTSIQHTQRARSRLCCILPA